jgi:hypothetical protein
MSYAALQRKCSCGGGCGACGKKDAPLLRSALSNAPELGDPMHDRMIEERRREEGLDPSVPGGPSDAFLKYSCPPPGKFTPLRTATVKVVRIAKDDGTDPTATPDLSVAKAIFRRCCVELNVQPVTTIRKTNWQTINSLGSGSGRTSIEQQDLALATNEDNKITVVSIRDFMVAFKTSTTTHGGALTVGFGTIFPVIMAVDIAVPEVIAHEVGHALGFFKEDAANPTIMKPTNAPTVANSRDVSNEICRAVQFGPMGTPSSIPCCQRPT